MITLDYTLKAAVKLIRTKIHKDKRQVRDAALTGTTQSSALSRPGAARKLPAESLRHAGHMPCVLGTEYFSDSSLVYLDEGVL